MNVWRKRSLQLADQPVDFRRDVDRIAFRLAIHVEENRVLPIRSDDRVDRRIGRGDRGDIRDANRHSGRGIFDGDLAKFRWCSNLTADEPKHEVMFAFDQAGRFDDVRPTNRVENIVDGNTGSDETRRIRGDLKFRNSAALYDYRGYAVKTIHARLDLVCGDFPKLGRGNAIGRETVTDDRENGERKAVSFDFCAGRKFGLQARDDGIHALKRENHVRIPVEEQIDFCGTAAGDGLYGLEARDAIDGFFDGARNRDEHLIDRHHAVVHAYHDAGKIGRRKNGNGHREGMIATNDSEADDQEEYRPGELLEPREIVPRGWALLRGTREERHARLVLLWTS